MLHKYSGVGFNTADPDEITCFFTTDRLVKNLKLFQEAERQMAVWALTFKLDFARSLPGNWVWFIMIYTMLKGTCSGWRLVLGGVDTRAKSDLMV